MAARDSSPSSTTSTRSNITVRTDKPADVRAMSSASPSISTPPTSLDDAASVLSEMTKLDHTVEADGEAVVLQTASEAQAVAAAPAPAPAADDTLPSASTTEGRRSARTMRNAVTTYNVQILAGTAIHTPTKYLEKHHKNVVHGDLETLTKREFVTPPKKKWHKRKSTGTHYRDPVQDQLDVEVARAAKRRTSLRVTDLRKDVLRNLSGVGDTVASSVVGGKTFLPGHSAAQRI